MSSVQKAIRGAKISPAVWKNWLPRPKVRTWDWAAEHVRAPNGAPFDADNYPWGRGVCDAYDNPQYREIDLMWASRLGKTFIGQCILLSGMANNPMPGIFASNAEKLAVGSVREKIYPMLERCRPLRDQLKPRARRSLYSLELRDCLIRIAWSGSDSTLADFGAYFLHCNEVDKWSKNKSSEADPVELAAERVKEFPDHKMIFESTPALASKSRIAPKLALSTNCRYWVACPWCHARQVLHMSIDFQGKLHVAGGGLIWDGFDTGEVDPDKAKKTARYVCEHCEREIHDEQRARMMRSGEWVAEGQRIDSRGRVHGTPVRDGHAWGSQLSSLYSLQMRWGDIAYKFVASRGRCGSEQNFINSWEGMPYTPGKSKTLPEELAARLKTEIPQQTVPAAAVFMVGAIDCQDGFFKYMNLGVGLGERLFLVDYGIADSWDELLKIVDRKYEVEGEPGEQLDIPITLIDSGTFTKDVYLWCKQNSRKDRLIIPCKGASNDMGGEPYQTKILGVGKVPRKLRRAALVARGLLRIHINVDYWEREIQKYLDVGDPGEPGSLSFCLEAADDDSLCKELLNGIPDEDTDSRNQTVIRWIKKDVDEPNDFRDCLRMARVAAEVRLRRNWATLRPRQKQEIGQKVGRVLQTPSAADRQRRDPPKKQFVRRPGSGFLSRRRS